MTNTITLINVSSQEVEKLDDSVIWMLKNQAIDNIFLVTKLRQLTDLQLVDLAQRLAAAIITSCWHTRLG